MIPLLLWILSSKFPWQGPEGWQELAAAVLFILASITDGVDGYLARKRGQITTMGILLDPLADKIMVTAALIALVAYTPQVVKVWIAVVIIGREFLISGLRSIAASEGFTIQASDLGKLKTVIQIVSVARDRKPPSLVSAQMARKARRRPGRQVLRRKSLAAGS